MRLLLRCLVAGIILILCDNANAQGNFSTVQGKIVLQSGQIKELFTLVLYKLPSNAIAAKTVLDNNGAFKFSNIASGNYQLVIAHTGYQNYSFNIIQVNKTLITLPPVTMLPLVTALKEVTITNKKDFIETRSDKTILNVDKGVMVGVSALDILGTAPGIRVNSGGNILFKGGQKATIAIDGRIINLASQDLIVQLENMQSTDISRIELIANPSAKYDAAGAGGLINIILKKGEYDGFNGSISEGLEYGNFGKIKSDINLNYRIKDFNFFGMYGFGENDTYHNVITNRYVGRNTNFNVNYYNKQHIYRHTYNFGVDYNIDNTHTVGVLVNGYFYNYFFDKNTQTGISNLGIFDSTLTTTSTLNRRFNNIDYNLNYNGKLGKTNQVLTADADYNIYNRTTNENLRSILFNTLNNTNGLPQFFLNRAPTRITNLSGKVDYINTISKSSKLEAGLKSIFAKSQNSQQFDDVISNNVVSNALLSNQFTYTENVFSAYANYSNNTIQKFSYVFGIRAEYTESDANAPNNYSKLSYINLFPNASLSWNFNKNHRLTLLYNRRIDRPSYMDLNPIIYYQDRYNVNAGNPYLRPSYNDRLELKHSYKNKLNFSVYASFTKDAFGFTYFSQNDATGVYTTGKTNFRQVNFYGSDINASVDAANWWNINFDTDISFQHFEDYAGLLNKSSFDAIFKLSQQFELPANTTISLFGNYEVPTFYTIYSYQESYYVNAGIRKQLMEKRAALGFTVDDIFNTKRDRYSSKYANLNLTGLDKAETRVFRLSFSYAFGKNTVKASRKHVTSNNDDMKRLKVD